ncbi:hypothetical protein [Treponema sp. R6D11]
MCWYCGEIIADPEPIGRSLRCETCGKDLRSCKNCRFFLPGSSGDCKESSAEPQADKERANFCDWFSLDQKYRSKTAGQNATKVAAAKAADANKTAFDNLFK